QFGNLRNIVLGKRSNKSHKRSSHRPQRHGATEKNWPRITRISRRQAGGSCSLWIMLTSDVHRLRSKKIREIRGEVFPASVLSTVYSRDREIMRSLPTGCAREQISRSFESF